MQGRERQAQPGLELSASRGKAGEQLRLRTVGAELPRRAVAAGLPAGQCPEAVAAVAAAEHARELEALVGEVHRDLRGGEEVARGGGAKIEQVLWREREQ